MAWQWQGRHGQPSLQRKDFEVVSHPEKAGAYLVQPIDSMGEPIAPEEIVTVWSQQQAFVIAREMSWAWRRRRKPEPNVFKTPFAEKIG